MKIFNKVSVAVLVIAFTLVLTGASVVHAVTPPDRGLGAADSYSVFGKAGVTNDLATTTHVWGNVGADSSVTNLDDATQVDGSIIIDGDTAGVATDARSTYDSLMSASQGTPTGLDLAGTHTGASAITPGVYTVGATTMNGDFELSGAGVYIFRSDSSATISTGNSANMILTHGACASNVFWAIPASMTIGTGAHIEGTIIANTGLISLATGATLVGRAISLTTQVTLDANQITEPTCSTLPHLTVTKEVVGGGPKSANNFPLFIDDVLTTTGAAVEVSAGAHVVTETTDSDYTQTFSSSCPGGNITLFFGIDNTCTITNTYVPPPSSHSSGGGTHYGCKDLNASNYEYFAASNPALCLYTATSTVVVYPVVAIASTTVTTTVTPVTIAATTVFTPKLPKTGFPPKEENIPWNIVMLLGIFMLVSTSSIVFLRKSKI